MVAFSAAEWPRGTGITVRTILASNLSRRAINRLGVIRLLAAPPKGRQAAGQSQHRSPRFKALVNGSTLEGAL